MIATASRAQCPASTTWATVFRYGLQQPGFRPSSSAAERAVPHSLSWLLFQRARAPTMKLDRLARQCLLVLCGTTNSLVMRRYSATGTRPVSVLQMSPS